MQKIHPQNLSFNKEEAENEVIYTWEKDEIAYYFCSIYNVVFKIQFTGERWFLHYRWGNDEKIYQYKYLECSDGRNVSRQGADASGISHSNEGTFFTTQEEAIEQGIRIIERRLSDAIKEHDTQLKSLVSYNK